MADRLIPIRDDGTFPPVAEKRMRALAGIALGIFPISAYGVIDGQNDEVAVNAAYTAASAAGGGTVWQDVKEIVCHAPIVPKAGVAYQGQHTSRYEVVKNPASGSKIRVGAGFVGSGLIVPGNEAKGVSFHSIALVGDEQYNSTGGAIHGMRMPDINTMNGEQGWHLNGVTIAGFSGSGIFGTVWVWSIVDLFIHNNLRYGTETAVGTGDKWNDSKIVNMWCFFNRLGGSFFAGGVSAGLQWLNCRWERSGQVFGNPENNPVDPKWVNDAAGFRVLRGQLMQLTNCSTDANTGPGYDFYGLSADVNNIVLTACGAFRDCGGAQDTTPLDLGGFRVSGPGTSANSNTQNIQFYGCYVVAGKSKDGGAATDKPITPKYGLQYKNALQTLWDGRPPAGNVGDFLKQGEPYGCGFRVIGLDGVLRYIRDGRTATVLAQ